MELKHMPTVNIEDLNELKSPWNETKARLKQRYMLLTNNDLMQLEGKQDELIDRLQIRLGKTKEQIVNLIAGL
jgi:uncharacterized protein YjbJ (UPF0337 family)